MADGRCYVFDRNERPEVVATDNLVDQLGLLHLEMFGRVDHLLWGPLRKSRQPSNQIDAVIVSVVAEAV